MKIKLNISELIASEQYLSR